jgi:hypothetical protein
LRTRCRTGVRHAGVKDKKPGRENAKNSIHETLLINFSCGK